MALIHPTAIVDPTAELDETVEVGPFCIIGKDVRIGAGTRLLSHVTICKHTRIGENNVIHMGCVIGHDPQFIGFDSSLVTATVIGNDNHFRENVTIHRSIKEDGETRIGDSTFLMVNSHVGHDSVIGNRVVLANAVLIAGHVTVGDRAFLSGNAGVHQFCRVGALVMVSGLSRITVDVPPYCMAEGNSILHGLNVVGLRRAGVSSASRQSLNRAFKILFRSGLTISSALEAIRIEWQDREQSEELKHLIEFCSEKSKRGLAHCTRKSDPNPGVE